MPETVSDKKKATQSAPKLPAVRASSAVALKKPQALGCKRPDVKGSVVPVQKARGKPAGGGPTALGDLDAFSVPQTLRRF